MRSGILTLVLTRKTRFGITLFLNLIMQYYVQNLWRLESHFPC